MPLCACEQTPGWSTRQCKHGPWRATVTRPAAGPRCEAWRRIEIGGSVHYSLVRSTGWRETASRGMRSIDFTATARRLGMSQGVGVVLLSAAYAVTLAAGLSSLRSPQEPIGDPFFPILE